MQPSIPANTSGTARLMLGALGHQVGWQLPVYPVNPAAGAAWSRKTPGPFFERLISVRFTFTASAAVGNRFIEVGLTDNNGAVITHVPAGFTISAGQTAICNLFVNGPAYDTTGQGSGFGFLPDVVTPPDWAWSASVVGLDVADQFSGIALLVQQFPNDAAREIL